MHCMLLVSCSSSRFLFEGGSTRGAQRWLVIGSFSFQPSEVAKVTLVLMMAHYFATRPSMSLVNRIIIPGIVMFPGFLLIPVSA